MSPIHSLALLGATALLAGCATKTTAPAAEPRATATLRAPDGAARGLATLVSVGGKLELRIAAIDLPGGVHGMHLHAVGSCNAPDFASAGTHLNPHAKMHGADNPQGSHLGDLPNLTAAADGKAVATAHLAGTQADVEPLLFDGDGTSVVIHATADDYKTDPSGNSGARIACGVLARG